LEAASGVKARATKGDLGTGKVGALRGPSPFPLPNEDILDDPTGEFDSELHSYAAPRRSLLLVGWGMMGL
jgi:hypothetical protein